MGDQSDLQEHPAAAQTVDHPIVKNARPEYPSSDERINVLSFSAINGRDCGDTSQGIYKVYRRFVHSLRDKNTVSNASQARREKKRIRGKVRDGTENTYQSFQV